MRVETNAALRAEARYGIALQCVSAGYDQAVQDSLNPDRVFGSDTERDASTYVIHAERGVIESLNGPFLQPYRKGSNDWPESVKVVYTTATGSVPVAVKQANSDLVGHWYRLAKTNSDANFLMLTELTSSGDTKGYSWSLTRGLTIPPGVLELLASFRVPAI